MNNVEAKFILQGYRPNGADAEDATFSAALAQARSDPALSEWFAREQAFDRAVSAGLAAVQPPAGLREAILAGSRMSKAVEVRPSRWRQPVWLAAAAAIAVLLAVGLVFRTGRAAAGPDLAEFVQRDAAHEETHGGHGDKAGALQAALMQPTARLGDKIPVNFAALRDSGCRTLSFNGREVLEVCFKRDGTWFHCYIAKRADFPALVAAATPALVDHKGASIASWADATLVYMVVSGKGRAALERLL